MTQEEASTILEIMSHADGGCYHCVAQLYAKFIRSFPEYRQMALDVYDEEHKGFTTLEEELA